MLRGASDRRGLRRLYGELVATSRAERFATELSRACRQATGVIPGVWICEAAEGAEVIVPAAA
jgi:hypothetical protein